MFDWLMCGKTCSQELEQHEYSYTRTSRVVPVSVEKAGRLDNNQQKILNTFKQGHILESYQDLKPRERDNLLDDLELLEFDIIDLNFHNLVKKNEGGVEYPLFIPSEKYVVDRNKDFSEEYREEMKELGYKLIAEGKVAVILNLSGVKEDLCLNTNKGTHIPHWEISYSIIEYYIRKLKALGKFCVEKYGKLFTEKKEPILLLVQLNEKNIDKIDNYLILKHYFGYAGMICFTTEVMPNLTEKGKIQFQRKDQLSFSSLGSGGFLKCLGPDGLMKLLNEAGVEFLSVVGSRDLNADLCDPVMLGYAQHRRVDCTFQVFKKKKGERPDMEFPYIFENQQETLSFYYPNEVITALKQNIKLMPEYGLTDLNMIISLKYLQKMFKEDSGEIFKYRLKQKLIRTFQKKKTFDNSVKPMISFELNLFNLIKLTHNVKMILRDKEDAVLMIKGPGSSEYSEKTMIEGLLKIAKKKAKECLSQDGEERDVESFTDKRLFHAYVEGGFDNRAFLKELTTTIE